MTRRAGCFILLCTLCATACAQRHVQLMFPDASPGAEFTCHPTEGQAEVCEPATVVDPPGENREGTVYVTVPRECQGHFDRITIHDSGSSKPTVDVKCAPPENRIQ